MTVDPAIPIILWDASLRFFLMEKVDSKPSDPSMSPMKPTPNGPCYMQISGSAKIHNSLSRFLAYAKKEKSVGQRCYK